MPIKQLVVGVDGTAASRRAVQWSAELAAAVDAQVVALHVVVRSWLIELGALQIDTTELLARVRAQLTEEWTEPLRDLGVRYTTTLVEGDPATELLAAVTTRHADLVVIGGTHHSGVRDALLGGTAHRVVNRCAIPVVVVPEPGHERPERLPPIPG
jgi:nucleotide-binding universal stress UspA family protein